MGERLGCRAFHVKQVKTVTRDRASSYASAIQQILLDALQIADRFHLHQNLREAIRNTINAIMPVNKNTDKSQWGPPRFTKSMEEERKKTSCIVDNIAEYNEKSVQLYLAIHEYAVEGYSKRAIVKELHCSNCLKIV